MDPNTNYERQRLLAQRLLTRSDTGEDIAPDAVQLAQDVTDLDAHCKRGGFLPADLQEVADRGLRERREKVRVVRRTRLLPGQLPLPFDAAA